MKLIMDTIGLCRFGKGATVVLDGELKTFQNHHEKDCDCSLQVSPRTLLAMLITVGN